MSIKFLRIPNKYILHCSFYDKVLFNGFHGNCYLASMLPGCFTDVCYTIELYIFGQTKKE